MVKNKKGIVINLASGGGFNPIPYNTVYCAMKAYVISFTQGLSYEYSDKGIQCLVVCPSPTDTNFFNDFSTFGNGNNMRTPENVVATTFKALKKNKTICTDGHLSFFQSIMPHILTRKHALKITGRIGEKTWK